MKYIKSSTLLFLLFGNVFGQWGQRFLNNEGKGTSQLEDPLHKFLALTKNIADDGELDGIFKKIIQLGQNGVSGLFGGSKFRSGHTFDEKEYKRRILWESGINALKNLNDPYHTLLNILKDIEQNDEFSSENVVNEIFTKLVELNQGSENREPKTVRGMFKGHTFWFSHIFTGNDYKRKALWENGIHTLTSIEDPYHTLLTITNAIEKECGVSIEKLMNEIFTRLNELDPDNKSIVESARSPYSNQRNGKLFYETDSTINDGNIVSSKGLSKLDDILTKGIEILRLQSLIEVEKEIDKDSIPDSSTNSLWQNILPTTEDASSLVDLLTNLLTLGRNDQSFESTYHRDGFANDNQLDDDGPSVKNLVENFISKIGSSANKGNFRNVLRNLKNLPDIDLAKIINPALILKTLTQPEEYSTLGESNSAPDLPIKKLISKIVSNLEKTVNSSEIVDGTEPSETTEENADSFSQLTKLLPGILSELGNIFRTIESDENEISELEELSKTESRNISALDDNCMKQSDTVKLIPGFWLKPVEHKKRELFLQSPAVEDEGQNVNSSRIIESKISETVETNPVTPILAKVFPNILSKASDIINILKVTGHKEIEMNPEVKPQRKAIGLRTEMSEDHDENIAEAQFAERKRFKTWQDISTEEHNKNPSDSQIIVERVQPNTVKLNQISPIQLIKLLPDIMQSGSKLGDFFKVLAQKDYE